MKVALVEVMLRVARPVLFSLLLAVMNGSGEELLNIMEHLSQHG